ncbi:unnamed protein product [Ascophyllum nodosum]
MSRMNGKKTTFPTSYYDVRQVPEASPTIKPSWRTATAYDFSKSVSRY